jgi:hypothetical protein
LRCTAPFGVHRLNTRTFTCSGIVGATQTSPFDLFSPSGSMLILPTCVSTTTGRWEHAAYIPLLSIVNASDALGALAGALRDTDGIVPGLSHARISWQPVSASSHRCLLYMACMPYGSFRILLEQAFDCSLRPIGASLHLRGLHRKCGGVLRSHPPAGEKLNSFLKHGRLRCRLLFSLRPTLRCCCIIFPGHGSCSRRSIPCSRHMPRGRGRRLTP